MAEERKKIHASMPDDKKSKFAEDMKQVGGSVWKDIIVPTIKKLLVDTVTKGFHMIVYGKMPTDRTNYGYTNYATFGGQISTASGLTLSSTPRPSQEPTARPGYAYERIQYASKEDAQNTIDYINSLIETNGYAKIGDIFDAVGLDCPQSAWELGWREPINPRISMTTNADNKLVYLLIGFPKYVRL